MKENAVRGMQAFFAFRSRALTLPPKQCIIDYVKQPIAAEEIMEDIKSTVAKNITDLRILNNMTQMELGAKLNYSDKTISKWERGESTPDIAVLVQIASLFGVSLDYLAGIENIDDRVKENARSEKNTITASSPILRKALSGVWRCLRSSSRRLLRATQPFSGCTSYMPCRSPSLSAWYSIRFGSTRATII